MGGVLKLVLANAPVSVGIDLWLLVDWLLLALGLYDISRRIENLRSRHVQQCFLDAWAVEQYRHLRCGARCHYDDLGVLPW